MKRFVLHKSYTTMALFMASLFLLSHAKIACAVMVTYKAEGVIEESIVPSLVVGSSYSAMLSFDPVILTSSPDPLGGISYSFASFSFTSGSVNLGGNNISIAIDDNGTTLGADAVRIDGALSGSFIANLRINLVKNDGSLFSSNSFPDPFPTLSDFDFGQLLINTSTTNFASLDVFEPIVPIPAAAYLFSSGLLGLIGIARRKSVV